MHCSAAVGCAGRLGALTASGCARWLTGVGLIASGCARWLTGVGLIASGCARWLTGVGLTATFAVGLALVRVARRGGAFFAAFFLIILVFLTVFLRLAVLVTVVFLRFALALVFGHGNLPDAHCIWKVFVRSLPNKKVRRRRGVDCGWWRARGSRGQSPFLGTQASTVMRNVLQRTMGSLPASSRNGQAQI